MALPGGEVHSRPLTPAPLVLILSGSSGSQEKCLSRRRDAPVGCGSHASRTPMGIIELTVFSGMGSVG